MEPFFIAELRYLHNVYTYSIRSGKYVLITKIQIVNNYKNYRKLNEVYVQYTEEINLSYKLFNS